MAVQWKEAGNTNPEQYHSSALFNLEMDSFEAEFILVLPECREPGSKLGCDDGSLRHATIVIDKSPEGRDLARKLIP
jgi:hypothetical protein